jgi:hypothetical protein
MMSRQMAFDSITIEEYVAANRGSAPKAGDRAISCEPTDRCAVPIERAATAW